MKRQIIIGLFLILSTATYSQKYQWWYDKVNYNGSPWNSYIIKSPGFLGPNALPVPDVQNGKIPDKIIFENGLAYHSIKGDQTQNIILKLTYPISKNLIALDFIWIPIEYYKTDTLIRDERRAMGYDGKGIAFGDLYFGTVVRLFRNNEKLPPISLGMYFKTALGGELINARYTDNTAYYFKLSSSKTIPINKKNLNQIDIAAMLGFYCWQSSYANNGNGKSSIDGINNIGDYQDDAPLFGTSVELVFRKFSWGNSFSGYWGYVNNRDRPLIYKSWLKTSFTKFDIKIGYQHGLHDVYYRSLTFSFIFKLDTFKNEQDE